MGRLHARAVARRAAAFGDVQLAWVVDRHPARAAAVAEEHGARAAEAIEAVASELDVAVVAVPTASHVEVAEGLLAAGVDLLVEKPMAPDHAAARALAERAVSAGRVLAVGHSEWFNPAIVAARDRVAEAERVEIVREAPASDRGRDLDVVQDLMLHDLDWLARVCTAELRLRSVRGRAVSDHIPEQAIAAGRGGDPAYVDEAEVELEMSDGRTARLRASRVAKSRRRFVRVGAGDGTDAATIELEATSSTGREPLDLAWADFLSACEERGRPTNDAAVGVAAVEQVEAIQRRLRSAEGR